jgi:glycosyltransferase involved in cell wall biosynthesis
VGEGPDRARYEAELQRLGLADAVQFLGYRYDVPELTAAADVVVLTSIKEGIPRALMQAMAVGVPVVATNVKGSREVVADGRTGFLVPLDDDQALAERIGILLDAPTLRRQMGTCGVEHVRRHFDEEQVTRRLVEIYRDALQGKVTSAVREPALVERLQAGGGGA